MIYEVGAGNGTLMMNILDHLAATQPEVYEKTQYNIIEISSKLADRQSKRFDIREIAKRHKQRVKIINKSIFDWRERVVEPCFFIAMEVIVRLFLYILSSNLAGQLFARSDSVQLYDQHTLPGNGHYRRIW